MTLTRSDVEVNQRRMRERSGRRRRTRRETFLKIRQEDVREETVETHHVKIQKQRGNKKTTVHTKERNMYRIQMRLKQGQSVMRERQTR